MTRRQGRMLAVTGLVLGVAAAAALGFTAFSKNLMYFQTPTDIAEGKVPPNAKLRLGGLVEVGSVARGEGLKVSFSLADCSRNVPVDYEGILPDLFREGQGIVATGRVENGRFIADEVLAKHDENYMPPELAASLQTADGHSCAPFKSASQPQAAADAPRPAQQGEGVEGSEGAEVRRADGGVRGAVRPASQPQAAAQS